MCTQLDWIWKLWIGFKKTFWGHELCIKPSWSGRLSVQVWNAHYKVMQTHSYVIVQRSALNPFIVPLKSNESQMEDVCTFHTPQAGQPYDQDSW